MTGPQGSHPYYGSPEPFIQCTYAAQPCGCRIDGNGTLQHPLYIQRCAKHAAAPELLDALRSAEKALADEMENRQQAGSDYTDYADEIANPLAEVRAAIAKADGRDA